MMGEVRCCERCAKNHGCEDMDCGSDNGFPHFEPKPKPCPECGGEIPRKGRLTSKQREAADKWEAISGFEMMHLDEVRKGEMTFAEAFNRNVRWLENVVASASKVYHGMDCDCGHEEKVGE